ncbi:MAG: TetR/AcrR family transcriptional regulator [Thermomicrobiales bacterium]|nr:TetR/AcrR family transcriptional regulator [Thermomicrobiales bacterium]
MCPSTPATRTYRKRKRAVSEAETRQRIVDAAIAMHQSKGNAATISEVARVAGISRITLYRHFPDELALLTACTSHYMEQHPLPDLATWTAIEDPIERLRKALADVFAYHRENVRMMTAAEHGVAENPTLSQLLQPLVEYWEAAVAVLTLGFPDDNASSPFIRQSIALAVSLPTWRLLAQQRGLSDEDCVEMFVRMVACLAETNPS